ncbi:hypothetical protein [uncultured Apibacter sp.]|uniref:hypothetical protein n=1 Tax=uncultured Apibacter sp. TaxID=1778616 RepID=UPI0025FBE5E7|nr:hypothetical protein [uncultured Apibacter sp.]
MEEINDSKYKVYYPSLDCSGTWTLIENKKYKKFKEEITDDKNEICIPAEYLLLVDDDISPYTKRFYLYINNEDNQPIANGFLNEVPDDYYQD